MLQGRGGGDYWCNRVSIHAMHKRVVLVLVLALVAYLHSYSNADGRWTCGGVTHLKNEIIREKWCETMESCIESGWTISRKVV